MSRRVRSLLVGGVLFIVLFVLALTLPVPYAILSPGPTFNTLGKDDAGHQIIVIKGAPTHATSGHLNMTTVDVSTDSVSVIEALTGWLQDDEVVVPRTAIIPPNQSQQQVDQQNQADFTDSQDNATAAAMCELGYPKQFGVQSVRTGVPAASVLKPGDGLVSLDGAPINTFDTLSAVLAQHQPGQTVHLVIVRAKQTMTVPVQLIAPVQGRKGASIGIAVTNTCLAPFTVDVGLSGVGGPSAGLMFALAIVDTAGTVDLTRGAFIAGTGTINASGAVGPIGGIQLKMLAARRAGATVFLAPADNCPDVRGNIPGGLNVVKVTSLHGAITALLALQAGRPVPHC